MNATEPTADPPRPPLVPLKLMVPEDLYRAFQRCIWIRIQETGQTQVELMEEVLVDFLKKHGC